MDNQDPTTNKFKIVHQSVKHYSQFCERPMKTHFKTMKRESYPECGPLQKKVTSADGVVRTMV